jgi:glycosyltransferase involved in cell wall biosynthesis
VLTEAAYFGCPAISVNRFAIPELVADGVTGILVDPPASPNDVAEAIASLLEDPDRYAKMRADTRARALERYSWNFVGGFMCDRIDERIA